MEKVLVYIDAGFISKLTKHFGKGNYMKFDLDRFSKLITGREGLVCKKIMYYNAPPFQSTVPTEDERRRKEGHDSYIDKLSRCEGILIRKGGRCQKLMKNGKPDYGQKGVDTLISMDLARLDIEYPKIKTIILVGCDSDVVPAIKALEERGIETILYTYSERNRKSKFSTSNYLRDSVSRSVQLKPKDFEDCRLF